MPIRKLLVANRGEIAVRVFRTCRELGIATVAVVAPDDAGSLHARSADEGVEIASYLHSEEHIRAAKASGADAIHPGYGFLAENADFAAAVEAAGLTWVGPPPEALRLGGDKLAAKRIAREAGVPTSPGRHAGGDRLPARREGGGRRRRARDARRPIGRRARRRARGGRARGGRRVRRRHALLRALPRAPAARRGAAPRRRARERRRARRARLLGAAASSEGARGGAGPRLSPALRSSLHEAAVAFGRAIGYRSAGTVEFVVEGDDFFFLELNGRIQVEHPVTEAVTGLDLVAEQLRIADGEPLATDRTRSPGTRSRCGCTPRIRRTFLPQTGRIEHARLSARVQRRVRVDAGVEEGDEVGLAYDPMIAKLIAHASTREEALDALAAALAETASRA